MQRNRTLTPTVNRTKNAHNLHKAEKEILTEEEQRVFDEEREEEMLKQAAERKERAQKMRERQEKHLNKIKEKKVLEA